MSGARKLQTEIDRVMKKVDEGVELFDEIYEKVYTSEQQSQKEKYEIELKKEIKKLQRLRDQIKSWISGTEVKDKDGLMEYRRLIETKMEAFKVVEKETKTKTFSKEGLARQDKVDPEEQKREDTIEWMSSIIEQLQGLIDEVDLEIVKLSAGKGKKTNKSQLEDCSHHMKQHKFHMSKLEGIMRLVRNDRIAAETVDEVKEDLEYYIESHAEDDYMMAYDEESFYEALGLEELDVVMVDTVTQTNPAAKKKDDDATSASSGSELKNNKKPATGAGLIPLTIGRARKSSGEKDKVPSSNEATPTKISIRPASSSIAVVPATAPVGPTPTPIPPSSPPGAGTSMAAVLKRESEERQRAQLQAAVAQAQQEQQAELMRQQQQLQKQQQAEAQRLQQADALRHQLEAQQKAQAQQTEAKQRQQQQMAAAQLQLQQQEQKMLQDAAAKQQLLQQQQQQQQQAQSVLNAGLSSLSLGNTIGGTINAPITSSSSSNAQPFAAATSIASSSSAANNKDVSERYLSALNDSFLLMPTSGETERVKSYTPRNPYPAAPICYPTTPSPILDNPAVFEKLGVDALFFIFYYAQGTYQQYLAARELKKQSWRYHKKYMTWFQRHEEPKVTTDDYEQGTYVYFDYETGWCQRIKSDFRFEYSFLEDSLQ